MVALIQVLMYASAVFYPLSRVENPQVLMLVRLNPLTYFSEESRNLMVWGEAMDWVGYGWVTLSGLIFMFVSYRIFMSFKPAFADVI